ncbi:MAG: DUF2218 domain-containing protein [Pseudonocardiaceae bacterium]
MTSRPTAGCTMAATAHLLRLRIEAGDEPDLQRLQDIITRNIERFGRREQLTVTWRPLQPVGLPGHAVSTPDPRPNPGSHDTSGRACWRYPAGWPSPCISGWPWPCISGRRRC